MRRRRPRRSRRLADACDVFVTVDRSLSLQQRLNARPFATVLLLARTNRVVDLLPLVPELRAVIARTRPGEVTSVARQPGVVPTARACIPLGRLPTSASGARW